MSPQKFSMRINKPHNMRTNRNSKNIKINAFKVHVLNKTSRITIKVRINIGFAQEFGDYNQFAMPRDIHGFGFPGSSYPFDSL